MDLNQIQLSPRQIAELYATVLVDTPAMVVPDTVDASFLGGNAQRILIIVKDEHHAYLPERELQFLKSILSACKLTLADVAIVNWLRHAPKPLADLLTALAPSSVLLFAITPQEIGLPVHFPHYQLQALNGQTYLSAPALTEVEHDKAQKKRLWNA